MLNLDTHVLVFALIDQLRPKEKAILSKERWGISAIVLWEIAKLFQLGRIDVDLGDPVVVRALSQIHLWPIDLPICQKLSSLDFSGDPADEIIAATSIVHRVPLLTRDATIRKSKLVPLVYLG